MSEGARRISMATSMVALAAVVAVGLLTAPGSPNDRAAALGDRIRCPVCQNEAIADSPSETAREMLSIVEEKVAAGESDRQIEQFFIDRYGDWIILDPPLDRRFLLLWGLPPVVLGLGLVVIARRRRAAKDAPEMDGDGDLRDHALTDIEELKVQVEEGDIPAEIADDLMQRYEIEAQQAPKRKARPRNAPPKRQSKSRGRMVAGWLIGLASVVVAVVLVAQTSERGAPTLTAQELSEVSNEELEDVVAENPNVLGMRMALADRYFDEGEWERALTHYLEVLKKDKEEADAWARVGWSAYQLGEVEIGAGYVERSLLIKADDPESMLYLGMIRLYGQEDAEAALPLLQRVDMQSNVPPAIQQSVDEAIAEAEQTIAKGGKG